jgi:cell division protease FtsH
LLETIATKLLETEVIEGEELQSYLGQVKPLEAPVPAAV